MSKQKKKDLQPCDCKSFLIAGMGFEPHDLRVMSPTSYQAALPRDIELFGTKICRTPGSNRYEYCYSRDFKSRASAYSATPAFTDSPALPECLYIIADSRRLVNTFFNLFLLFPVFPSRHAVSRHQPNILPLVNNLYFLLTCGGVCGKLSLVYTSGPPE